PRPATRRRAGSRRTGTRSRSGKGTLGGALYARVVEMGAFPMPESMLACPSCSRPLDPATARDGEIKCACGVLVGVEAPELDTVDQAAAVDTLDSTPSQVSGIEAIPAGTADKFSEEFLQQ